MKVDFKFTWFDFWIGFYWSKKDKILYICPLPMCVFLVSWQRCAGSCKRPIFSLDGDPYCMNEKGDCIPF